MRKTYHKQLQILDIFYYEGTIYIQQPVVWKYQVFLKVYYKYTHLHIGCQFANLHVLMKPNSETMILFLLYKPSANPSPNVNSKVIVVWIVKCQEKATLGMKRLAHSERCKSRKC